VAVRAIREPSGRASTKIYLKENFICKNVTRLSRSFYVETSEAQVWNGKKFGLNGLEIEHDSLVHIPQYE
jgi:hypothetical protein